ncbi:hypothetical protein [Lysinibacter sp. HNR]|uniref:VOC family protein n=1 Tax=Lysinibacter sp. HNR TaxID=3031408 RepID=UPI002435EF0B|nr:hypothetical protein [Lysinibacter sp. HNR]WGD37412.1 hypothetical protein FrondiHNR_00370 [Lysinibacter sp. HNR]
MHAELTTPHGLTLMVTGHPCSDEYIPGKHSYFVVLNGIPQQDDLLTGFHEKLSEGATIHDPLAQGPWGNKFAMLTDKFNAVWFVNVKGA